MIKFNKIDDKFSKEKKSRNFGLKQIILQHIVKIYTFLELIFEELFAIEIYF